MSNKKRVLYISYDGMTDPLGQSQVIPYLEKLSGQGYAITILSVEKKARWKKEGESIKQLLDKKGIQWVHLFFTSKPPLASKVYDQWNLNRRAERLHDKEKFDLVHCRSYVAAAAALKLNRKYQLPFLFDMRGFWVDERVDSGQWNLQTPLYRNLYKSYKKKEKEYFSSAAHIVSLTEKGKQELTAKYAIPAEKISVIPCCVDLDLFDFHSINSEQRLALRNKLAIHPGELLLSYLGSLGGWYMTGEMLDFFAVLLQKKPQAVFLFITHNEPQSVVKMAEQRGIPGSAIRVIAANRNEVPAYLSISDWSIFMIRNVYSKIASSPTKQGEVMGMGVPLICNDIGDTGAIVRDGHAGLLLDEFSQKGYETIAQKMVSGPAFEQDQIREGARKYYDLENGVRKYLQIYQRLIA